MRSVFAVLLVVASSGDAAADPVELSGSLGAGLIGTEPVSIAAAELDIETTRFSLGVGVALRMSGSEIWARDWDQWRDGARLLRHLLWRPQLGSTAALSVAAGQLDAIAIGHGTVVDGIATGVDLDRQRLGTEARVATARSRVHLWVDDAIDPEIGAVHVAGDAAGPIGVGATLAADRGAAGGALGTLGVEIELAGERGAYAGGVYSDLVRAFGGGAGVHLGVRGSLGPRSDRIGLRLEGHAATAGYLAGWIGPLYVRDRQLMSDRPGGVGGLVELEASRSRFGRATIRLEHRAGRGPGGRLELRVPHLRWVQTGAWAAIARDAAAFGAELRVRFPRSLFARLEARRQYTSEPGDVGDAGDPMSPQAIWTAAATFGATLGE